ncbi:MAG: hypothetical protein LAO51_03730 [Acidobacteriia bacterium]|nr:hypothetical protein [Terriglobia bacterium]
MATHFAAARVLGCVALCAAFSFALAGTEEQKPKDLGLVEKTGAHLGQLEITVTGPRDIASRLTAADFEVQVGKRSIETFHLDSMCAADSSSTLARPANYLFYFDQQHLTPTGRRRALDVVREMIPRLILDGSRGMVVSSARTLKVFTQFTPRAELILKALRDMEVDPDQVDASPLREEGRVDEIESDIEREDADQKAEHRRVGALQLDLPDSCTDTRANNKRDQEIRSVTGSSQSSSFRASAAAILAQQFEQDEMAAAREDLLRVVGLLRRFGGIESPKVFLYFADTMRRNAGEHFVKMVPPGAFSFARTITRKGAVQQVSAVSDRGALDSRWSGAEPTEGRWPGEGKTTGSEGAFDEVLAEAAAQNVRFYPVQAEGLTFSSSRGQDAQDTLATLALETGGKAFLNGIPADQMAGDILTDLSCTYMISFDPTAFPMDRPLPVQVRVHGKRLSAHVQRKVVIQSESARRTSRLLAAYAGTHKADAGAITATVVPTGFVDGAFVGLVQVIVPSPSEKAGSWEIGGTIVSGNTAREIATRMITTNMAGIPVVFEAEETFPAGHQEVVAVARETSTDTVVSQVVDVTWPEIGASTTILPIAVMQPVNGAFVRGDATRAHGSVARSESEALRADVPTALVGLVCWSERETASLHVERSLRGDAETTLSFPALDLEPGNDRCTQVRDVIPAGTLGSGWFRYSIVVTQGQEELAKTERNFVVQATSK